MTGQQQKDFENLQKMGEEAGKNAIEDIQKIADVGNKQSNEGTQKNKTLKIYSKPVNSKESFSTVLSITFTSAITLIIAIIFMKRAKKDKEKSKLSNLNYKCLELLIGFVCFEYIALIIRVFIPNTFSFYTFCAILCTSGYYRLKSRSLKTKKDNIKKESMEMDKDRNGVVLGSLNERLIIKECKKPGNVLCVGAPGKGKSQCLSIPTLLNWKGSALVVDIKRELYAYTHNVQAKKGKVIVFDPEQDGHAYDPIRECDTVDGCQFLARSLIPTPKDGDPFWTGNAQNVLAAACYEGYRKGKTLPEIAERILLTEPEILVDQLTNSEYKETRLLASSVKGTPDKTLGGIFTELKNSIILFSTDENIKRALSKSEWSAQTLEEGATIYLRVSERQVETYKKVWNLIIVQVLRHLNSRGEHKDPAILLLLDELPRLGKVEKYIDSLGTLRSKDVTIFSAAQSLAQFQLHYGKEATRIIMDTNNYKVCLSASDDETQQVFSKLAGKYEREKESTNMNWTPGNFVPGMGKSKFTQWEERFRPETLAYLERPIYYSPDKEAFQINKVFWMDIPHLLKLQKESGGPTTFIPDEDFERLSKIEKSDFKNVDSINDISFKNELEKEEREKTAEYSFNVSSEIDEDNDNEGGGEEKESIGHIELFEKWDINR